MTSTNQRIAALKAEIIKSYKESERLDAEQARAEAAAHAAGKTATQIFTLRVGYDDKRRALQAARDRCKAEMVRLR